MNCLIVVTLRDDTNRFVDPDKVQYIDPASESKKTPTMVWMDDGCGFGVQEDLPTLFNRIQAAKGGEWKLNKEEHKEKEGP